MDLHELQTHFKEWRSLGAAFRDNERNPDDTIVEVVDEIAKLFEEFKHNNALHGRSLTESTIVPSLNRDWVILATSILLTHGIKSLANLSLHCSCLVL
jgi:hypothetical protein